MNYLASLARETGVKIALTHQCEGFALFGKKVAVRIRNLETNQEVQTSADILTISLLKRTNPNIPPVAKSVRHKADGSWRKF